MSSFSHVRFLTEVFDMHTDAGLQVSFLAIIPLERLFDYCGEQMAFYCGNDLGDLIVITLNKWVSSIFRSGVVSMMQP